MRGINGVREAVYEGMKRRAERSCKFRLYDGKDMHYYLLDVIRRLYQLRSSDTPIVVSQFTGVLDKGGTRIYDGDILEVWKEGRSYLTHVSWGKNGYTIKAREDNGEWTQRNLKCFMWDKTSGYARVCGNIFGDPLLAKRCFRELNACDTTLQKL